MNKIILATLASLSLGAHAATILCKVDHNDDLTKENLSYTGVAQITLDTQTLEATFTLKDGGVPPNFIIKERKETLSLDGRRLIAGENSPTNDGFAIYLSPNGEKGVLYVTRIGNIGKHGGMPQSESNYDRATCAQK